MMTIFFPNLTHMMIAMLYQANNNLMQDICTMSIFMGMWKKKEITSSLLNYGYGCSAITDPVCLFHCSIPDSIGRDIEKACQGIFPLHDVFVRKVKILKKPKFDIGKLMELHGEGSSGGKVISGGEGGENVVRPEGYEPPVLESV